MCAMTSNNLGGPRDWSPPEIDEDFDGIDPDLLAEFNPPAPPVHPLQRWAWIATAICLLGGILGWLLHGPGWLRGVLFVGAVVCAVVAVMASAPHSRDIDDDGARL